MDLSSIGRAVQTAERGSGDVICDAAPRDSACASSPPADGAGHAVAGAHPGVSLMNDPPPPLGAGAPATRSTQGEARPLLPRLFSHDDRRSCCSQEPRREPGDFGVLYPEPSFGLYHWRSAARHVAVRAASSASEGQWPRIEACMIALSIWLCRRGRWKVIPLSSPLPVSLARRDLKPPPPAPPAVPAAAGAGCTGSGREKKREARRRTPLIAPDRRPPRPPSPPPPPPAAPAGAAPLSGAASLAGAAHARGRPIRGPRPDSSVVRRDGSHGTTLLLACAARPGAVPLNDDPGLAVPCEPPPSAACSPPLAPPPAPPPPAPPPPEGPAPPGGSRLDER